MGPIHWIHGWVLAYGIYPWGSTLVMEDLMGRHFLGGLLIFLWGTGGEEKAPGHGQQGRSLDDTRFQTVPFCFILYIAQWKFRGETSDRHASVYPTGPH
jgi:hypothetical protein